MVSFIQNCIDWKLIIPNDIHFDLFNQNNKVLTSLILKKNWFSKNMLLDILHLGSDVRFLFSFLFFFFSDPVRTAECFYANLCCMRKQNLRECKRILRILIFKRISFFFKETRNFLIERIWKTDNTSEKMAWHAAIFTWILGKIQNILVNWWNELEI